MNRERPRPTAPRPHPTGTRLETAEQMLVIIVIAAIIVGVLALVILLVAAGMKGQVWGWIALTPMFAFPIGLLSIIALMIVGIVRRKREGPAQH